MLLNSHVKASPSVEAVKSGQVPLTEEVMERRQVEQASHRETDPT
jgi:hypothetical protein